MQHIDKSSDPAAPAGIGGQEGKNAGPLPDLQRRRLMRGAAVAVPAIITLRSGGVSASSICSAPLVGAGQFKNTSGQINLSSGTAPPGSTCVTGPVAECLHPSTGKLGLEKGFGTPNGTISNPSGSNPSCGPGRYAAGDPVWIVSATSACSLFPDSCTIG